MRGLWVIGASDVNLGHEVSKQGREVASSWDDNARYPYVFATTEQDADVTGVESISAYLHNHILPSGVSQLDVAYCAGVNLLDSIENISWIDLQQTFDVNVMGFIKVMHVLVRESKGVRLVGTWRDRPAQPFKLNSVVAVASDAARNPMRNSIAYCASKAALVQAVRVAARELAPDTRVNAVSPAIMDDTPMTWAIDAAVQKQRGWSEEEARDYERSLIPMRRRAFKHEVAKLILQTLAGPEFLTGSNIEITGGK